MRTGDAGVTTWKGGTALLAYAAGVPRWNCGTHSSTSCPGIPSQQRCLKTYDVKPQKPLIGR